MRYRYTEEQVAAVCHDASRRLQAVQGEEAPSQPWECESVQLRQSVIEGVRNARAGQTPEQLHESWRAGRVAAGYAYGPVRDHERKTHPCLVPYADLPQRERDKDRLFLAIVTAMSAF